MLWQSCLDAFAMILRNTSCVMAARQKPYNINISLPADQVLTELRARDANPKAEKLDVRCNLNGVTSASDFLVAGRHTISWP